MPCGNHYMDGFARRHAPSMTTIISYEVVIVLAGFSICGIRDIGKAGFSNTKIYMRDPYFLPDL